MNTQLCSTLLNAVTSRELLIYQHLTLISVNPRVNIPLCFPFLHSLLTLLLLFLPYTWFCMVCYYDLRPVSLITCSCTQVTFFLFSWMKNVPKGKHFPDVEEVKQKTAETLYIEVYEFKNCCEQWKKHLH